MTSVLFTIGEAVINALVFSRTIFFFTKLTDHCGKKCRRHYLVLERLQSTRDEWNKDRIKHLDFIH